MPRFSRSRRINNVPSFDDLVRMGLPIYTTTKLTSAERKLSKSISTYTMTEYVLTDQERERSKPRELDCRAIHNIKKHLVARDAYEQCVVDLICESCNRGFTIQEVGERFQQKYLENRCVSLYDTVRYTMRAISNRGDLCLFTLDGKYYVDDDVARSFGLNFKPKGCRMTSASRWGLFRLIKKTGIKISNDSEVKANVEKIASGDIPVGYTM